MIKIRKYHLYIADLNPTCGTEPGKVRPVAVVQTNLLNGVHPSTIICPLTTKVVKKAAILRVHLSKKETGLCEDSDIVVDQIRAIDNKRFRKHIGKLSLKRRQQLVNNLKILIVE